MMRTSGAGTASDASSWRGSLNACIGRWSGRDGATTSPRAAWAEMVDGSLCPSPGWADELITSTREKARQRFNCGGRAPLAGFAAGGRRRGAGGVPIAWVNALSTRRSSSCTELAAVGKTTLGGWPLSRSSLARRMRSSRAATLLLVMSQTGVGGAGGASGGGCVCTVVSFVVSVAGVDACGALTVDINGAFSGPANAIGAKGRALGCATPGGCALSPLALVGNASC
jgi:hypothetical protein